MSTFYKIIPLRKLNISLGSRKKDSLYNLNFLFLIFLSVFLGNTAITLPDPFYKDPSEECLVLESGQLMPKECVATYDVLCWYGK